LLGDIRSDDIDHLSPVRDSVKEMREESAFADWNLVLRRSFGVPDIVSGANALAAIEGWIGTQLESSSLIHADKEIAAEKFVPAIIAVAERGDLDHYVLSNNLSHYLRPVGTTPAEIVVREMYPEMRDHSTDTAQSLLAVAAEIVEQMVDYVERHKFSPQ
jgi:hypothetical protein